MLKARDVTLIAASAPTFFLEDTPTAVLVRQVLGAVRVREGDNRGQAGGRAEAEALGERKVRRP
jgi:hypothetical protein